LDESTFIDVMT